MVDVGGEGGEGKHLVYLVDGTWLWAGREGNEGVYGNIYRMAMLLSERFPGKKTQYNFYNRGIGSTKGFHKYLAGGFSYGITDAIADIYVNIATNFDPGDKIYIFGFSRGAVIARVVSGVLAKGLLKPTYISLYPDIWRAYLNDRVAESLAGSPDGAERVGVRLNLGDQLQDEIPEIEFLGVFDTVCGGVGATKKIQELNLKGSRVEGNVKNAIQLISIDESRLHFPPIVWTDCKNKATRFEQILMPGTHSDVGGMRRQSWISDVSLYTMINRVSAYTPLKFDDKEMKKMIGEDLENPEQTKLLFTDEFQDAWRYTKMWQKPRDLSQVYSASVHPCVDLLTKRRLNIRGENKYYQISPDLEALPRAAWKIPARRKGS